GHTERYRLSHPDDTNYIDQSFRRIKPKLTYKSKDLILKLGLTDTEITETPAMYQKTAEDDRLQFITPELYGKYQLDPVFIELVDWQESDVQVFNGFRYANFLYHNTQVAIGYESLENHSLKLSYSQINRNYPASYKAKKNAKTLHYALETGLGLTESFLWKSFSAEFSQTDILGILISKLSLKNDFTFEIMGLKHFLKHALDFTDGMTTYIEGDYRYSLIEVDEKKPDLLQLIELSGFSRIMDSGFFLSWKYRVEDSLTQDSKLDQLYQLKLVYAF
ncbi:MAG: hypothetical protein OEY59_11705, partial [Deltaproteobacteria bacterium]|nr:hypothetical protein [Deltaproteobacteria bacterium]